MAARAFVDAEVFSSSMWEPACGNSATAEVLLERYGDVHASDLYDRGYGETGVDFLTSNRRAANIVSNPPYNSAEGFLTRALDLADCKVAFLLRLGFVESARRQREIFTVRPPQRIWVSSERISFYPASVEYKDEGSTCYAWFVWDKQAPLAHPEMRWLPLGYKAASAETRARKPRNRAPG